MDDEPTVETIETSGPITGWALVDTWPEHDMVIVMVAIQTALQQLAQNGMVGVTLSASRARMLAAAILNAADALEAQKQQ